MNEKLEKYIGELSPEMQEKARECKDMAELNALLAENDVELSEDALQAVAGGCSSSDHTPKQGDPMGGKFCPICGQQLYYFDHNFDTNLLYCNNTTCGQYIHKSGREGHLFLWRDYGDHLASVSYSYTC